jgi:N6-L-threonylcarbamoyladenine synthase
MKDHFRFEILGETLDDAVGETYDKVGRVMGLEYPAGIKVDNLALQGEPTYKLPLVYVDRSGYEFSFSGLKSAVINIINTANMKKQAINVADLCASFQNSVVTVLVEKTINAIKEYQVKQIVVAGGVAANKGLRARMKAEVGKLDRVLLTFPSMKYCTDNAAMIAVAGYFQYLTR